MKAFLVGFGSGIALGMLFAPKSGDETRRQLRTRAYELSDRALEGVERVTRRAGQLRQQASRAIQQGSSGITQAAAQKVDSSTAPLAMLNTASREELMSVRGIGPVLADRIIQERPYTSAEQVVRRGILPESTFRELTRQAKSA